MGGEGYSEKIVYVVSGDLSDVLVECMKEIRGSVVWKDEGCHRAKLFMCLFCYSCVGFWVLLS